MRKWTISKRPFLDVLALGSIVVAAVSCAANADTDANEVHSGVSGQSEQGTMDEGVDEPSSATRNSIAEKSTPKAVEATGTNATTSLLGKDGPYTVPGANVIVNQYSRITADVTVGATTVTINDINDLNSATWGPLEAGDLVMFYQAQGASIDSTDTANYGNVTALNDAGHYEIVTVTAVAGNVLTLDTSCGGLKQAYTATGNAQVVRVPQLTSLTIPTGTSITGSAWDGQRGGIVALHVLGTTTITGTGKIEASAIGFRGGATDNVASFNGIVTYRSTAPADGAEKGEGIAGYQTVYDGLGGRYGRGAPANGGGGGNAHNAGGGGGANGKALMGFTTWNGNGVMDPLAAWLPAWQLDPAYAANGNALTTSLGGGRGGYSYSANNGNALTQGPDNPGVWGGDGRRSTGGFGGRPMDNDPTARVFFGGGGGAGDGNNAGAGGGGRGGGMVVLLSESVAGNGFIRANGANGANGTASDAAGGGGAGGTILIQSTNLAATLAIVAAGGLGGNQIIFNPEAEGPGGGGSGGFIATSGGAVTPTVNGANNGTSDSTSVTEFTANGATRGAPGHAGTLTGLVSCVDPPDTTIVTAEPQITNDPTGDFEFGSNKMNVTYECRIDGVPQGTCSQMWSTPSLNEGTHSLSVRAVDSVGNVDPTPATYLWSVDTMPPDTTIVAAEPNPTNDPTGDFVFSSDPTAIFECSLDGGAYAPCPATYATPSLSDGAHTLDVYAIDPAGNVDPTPATYTWVVDTMPPDTTIVTAEPNPTNDPTGDFEFGSNKMNVTYECSIDGVPQGPCSQMYSTPSLNEGTHSLSVRAVDSAGNVDPTPASYLWSVDTMPPDTTIVTAEPNPTNDPTGDFVFSSPDPTAIFECSLDGGAYAPCPATYSTASLSDGTHTLNVRAVDSVGNVDPTPATYTWVVDTMPPDTTIVAAEPNPTNDPTGDFVFSSDPTAIFECSLDGGAYAPCPATYSTPSLSDGAHTLDVHAMDPAGNVDPTPATYFWAVDTMPPDTTIVTAEPNPTNDPTGDFVFSSPDPTAIFECSIDGLLQGSCSQMYSTPSLSDGAHTLDVHAMDPAGNVDPTPATYFWVVDTMPPDPMKCAGVTCTALDQCHDIGTCDSMTGLCNNPNKADGSSCNDSNACTQSDTCQAGTCTGANPVDCSPKNECHEVGTCDPSTGTCSIVTKPDGSPCTNGTCQNTECIQVCQTAADCRPDPRFFDCIDNQCIPRTEGPLSSTPGCACSTTGDSSSRPGFTLLVLALGAFWARRKRAAQAHF